MRHLEWLFGDSIGFFDQLFAIRKNINVQPNMLAI